MFWPEKRRGGERLIRDLSDALMARGNEVRLITSHRGRPARDIEDGLEVIRQWRPPERPFGRLGLPPGTSHALPASWALRRGHDDIVQAWTIPAALAAAGSGRPSVFVFQGLLNEADLEGRPRVRSMLMRAAESSDAVTTYSQVAATELTRMTGVQARAIEPGIRLEAFTRNGGVRPRHTGDTRHPAPAIFCAADPDEPRKRVALLVEAFARVREAVPAAELWLMPSADASIASAPGVRVVDPGADRDALVALYRSAWTTVLPAFREAFGLVVVESLACGTPVVGMRDGGAVPQILATDGAVVGRLADPDAESLAAELLGAIASPPDAETAAACRSRAEDFS
ncbi:MAG: hypothetical protein QOC55_1492, partial [Thermoleophilaceae bacterium]|nr:hypothetical protein [Thermoleophilaceae bacterium]